MVGSPKATFSTTLAVLRPYARQGLKRRAIFGHLCAMLFDQDFGKRDDILGLAPIKADGLYMACASFSSPSATIFSGVSTDLNSGAVALLTLLSVAWADSATATSKV